MSASTSPPPAPSPPDFKVLRLARFTVPIHVALPVVIWQIGRSGQDVAVQFVLALHVVTLVVILAGYPWWRGYAAQLVSLIFIDHFATFASGIGLMVWLN